MAGPKYDLMDRRFGRLTVSGPITMLSQSRTGGVRWVCDCDCGRTVIVPRGSLMYGATRSCGCLLKEVVYDGSIIGDRSRTHGMSHTPEHNTWTRIRQRCGTPSNPAYPNYGGRGIYVCDRWLGPDGFANFLADMGSKPPGTTIERRDNDGPYSPGNCCWATHREQVLNTRNNVNITHAGKTMTAIEWSRATGIPHGTILARITRGWSHTDAVTKGHRRSTVV